MQVFKFGGASVRDAVGVKNVAAILKNHAQNHASQSIFVVISAMGKTTNGLETVVDAYFKQETAAAYAALHAVRTQHEAIAVELFGTPEHPIFDALNDIFVEIEWILEEEDPSETYDYLYDQIVSIGEFLSTRIVAAYLNELGIATTWLDARDVIRTDNTYRDGRIDWAETEARMQRVCPPLLAKGLVLTQGFVGGTSENFTTTLGREGSDYTAAIAAYCLNAESMTVWKDVPGILSADPRLFSDVTKIDNLSYREAIEMTYYGAQVIHPKTIKPLQNKNIPMYVQSFLQPSEQGTVIGVATLNETYPPMIVVKQNQVLLHISTRDFSFVVEEHLADIFALLAKHRLSANMMQNTAISFSVCLNNTKDRLDALLADLQKTYSIRQDMELNLVTIRHYNDTALVLVKTGKIVLLEERLADTVQIIVKNELA